MTVIRENTSFLFPKLQIKPCEFSFINMERYERIAQDKSHIATDSLKLANSTNSFSIEGREAKLPVSRKGTE